MGLLTKWIVTGFWPHVTFWVMFTVRIGSVADGLAALATGRRAPATQTPRAESRLTRLHEFVDPGNY